jgi:hypothetical protein
MLTRNPRITTAGLALFTNQAPGFSVSVTDIAVGSAFYDPTGAEVALHAEFARFPVSSGANISPSQIEIGALLKDADAQGRTPNNKFIGEVGFYVGTTLLAVLSQAQGALFYKSPGLDVPISYVLDFSTLPPNALTVNTPTVSDDLRLAAQTAQANAAAAAVAATQVRSTYYGPLAVAPTARPDGTASQKGDRYFDIIAGAEKTWNGAVWYIPNVEASAFAAPGGATQIGYGTGSVADALALVPVVASPRDALLYHNALSVTISRRFATMGGFRYRGHYTKARGPMLPLLDNIASCAPEGLGAESTFRSDNWYAAFAISNPGDTSAKIVTMPFLRVSSVAGNVVTLNMAGEMVHAQLVQTYAWKTANNLAGVDCLIISEGSGWSGRIAKITANSASTVTLDVPGGLAFGDFLLPAPPNAQNYVYISSFYMDDDAVRNIYDSGTVVRCKMNELQSPDVSAGRFTVPGAVLQCAGYISPLATAAILESGGAFSTATQGDYAEYFDPDGSNHIVHTGYMRKNATTTEPYYFTNIQIPFLYYQKFNYYNDGSMAGLRSAGKLHIKGWIEP